MYHIHKHYRNGRLRAMSNRRKSLPQGQYFNQYENRSSRRRPNNLRFDNRDRYIDHEFESKKPKKRMGFLMLQNLAKSENEEIISKFINEKEAFMHLIQSPIERPDIFALVLELLAKICESSFDQLKLAILMDIWNSAFIPNLRDYIKELPLVEHKSANNMYWEHPDEFWDNFFKFCECITTPSTAYTECRSLIETSKICLEALALTHDYQLPENCNLMLINLLEVLAKHTKEVETEAGEHRKEPQSGDGDHEPPENFRQLSIVPRGSDLINERPYLRANVVKGGYRNVEHYLDVQFRLFREDCFGPLRDGIHQFIQDPTKRKYDNIKVYHNVKFVEPYVSAQKVGSVVEFDKVTKKRFRNIHWNHNKRFIFGSLVIFTKDNTCKDLIVATILDKDVKYLANGKVPVSIIDAEMGDDLYNTETYTMIESEVYFEPYYHVLKAMQEPSFPQHIPLQKYIIDVNPEPRPPLYVNKNSSIKIGTKLSGRKKFHVLNFNTWPSCEEMNFNESQYEAYKMALTQEFAVIQGPPGTGKTYLGVRLAKTFIENLQSSRSLLLLVCYTNHALDQFLEAILPCTNSIVRIGSQSRNPAMEQINLNTIRKQTLNTQSSSRKLFFGKKEILKNSIFKLKTAQNCIQSLNNCIVSHNCIKRFVPESFILDKFDKCRKGNFKDPLCCWLFENVVYDMNESVMLEDEEFGRNPKIDAIDHTNDSSRSVNIDDFDTENLSLSLDMDIEISFSIEKAKEQIKFLKSRYRISESRREQSDLHSDIIVTRSLIRTFNEMKAHYENGVKVSSQADIHDLISLSIIDRWMLYFKWTYQVANNLREKIQPMQDSLRTVSAEYEESRMINDFELLKNYKVIGMTTSGAARLRKLIVALAPRIVIVEEAAEVLEQHIITSLTKRCQHLILIGDHQQLRPSASYMRLARHYDIEVSLFERMIANAIHSRRLSVQHRMRPQIAALISPAIYADLQNHPSVHDFPDVRGVTSNVFFFTHNYKEEVQDSASKTNEQEGDMVLGLANYLMQQDYKPEDVTILAAYSGQMFYMKRQLLKYSHLSKVKITVVDNYQGEESKIILLSLVRNNDDNKIGFLGTENRVCVALSRAKEGLYIFGNIEILKNNSPLWKKIAATLEGFGSLGTSLRLRCENHHDQISVISSPSEFSNLAEGGCHQQCNYILPCLHACPLMCHGYNRDHADAKCTLKCERIICELNHICPLTCMEECRPCIIEVIKKLPCGHYMPMKCDMDPNDPKVRCSAIVTVKLSNCDHEVNKPCHMAIESIKCPMPCDYRVDKCGHVCTRRCHVDDDPDHDKYLCWKPCARPKKGCTMELEDDHSDHKCLKKCHEECDDCNVQMIKKIPDCNHEISLECRIVPVREICAEKCARTLSCGHACRARCSAACDAGACEQLVQQDFAAPCGHTVQVPCSVYAAYGNEITPETLLLYCSAVCGTELVCEHACAGTCARCWQGRLHEACAQPCHQLHICGHQCAEPCSQVCPPCRKPCEVRCGHSRCRRECGAPCIPCQEPCVRKCAHSVCMRRCGQQCAHAACVLACPRTQACRHPCRGLCGERCPDVCKQCRPDSFPTDFLGDDFDDDALFIVLEDCNHVMEFQNMENLMKGDSDLVAIRCCPYCRKPILNTPRYKDLVNHLLTKEINPIKERVYGNVGRIAERREELHERVTKFNNDHHHVFTDIDSNWKETLKVITMIVKSKKKYSLLQLDLYFIYLNILELISDVHKKFTIMGLTEFKSSLVVQSKMICKVLIKNVHKISQQQQADIRRELQRMNTIVHLSQLISHQAYLTNLSAQVAESFNTAKAAILNWGVYEHDKATEALDQLQKAIKISGIVTKVERELIIKAVGAKAGQWFKCPNGHFYSIGQCGGAMEVAKCVECKADIGGRNHALLSSNVHAREFDNSRFAAYSEEANNMANFDLNDNV